MLLVLPADKGQAAVIMNTEEYKDKIRKLLSDERDLSMSYHRLYRSVAYNTLNAIVDNLEP